MQKFLTPLILIVFILFICGCGEPKVETENPSSEFSVIMPKDDTVNGYRTNIPSIKQEGNNSSNKETYTPPVTDGYFINTSTKKFHLHTCRYAKQGSANAENVSKSRDELLNDGYSPCKICKP